MAECFVGHDSRWVEFLDAALGVVSAEPGTVGTRLRVSRSKCRGHRRILHRDLTGDGELPIELGLGDGIEGIIDDGVMVAVTEQ